MTLLLKLTLTAGLSAVLLGVLWLGCHKLWDRIMGYPRLRAVVSWVDAWLHILVILLCVVFVSMGVTILVRLIWGL